MHKFAQFTVIWKKFQNSIIHKSRNNEIAGVSQSWKLSWLYDAITQKVISYKIEPEFLFEESMISLKIIDT